VAERDSLPVEQMPAMFLRLQPETKAKLSEQAEARGLSRGDYVARLLAAAAVAIEEQEAEPLQNTG
jgi:uncharacterized protein (DUF1778 family)